MESKVNTLPYRRISDAIPQFPTGGVPRVMPEGAVGDVNSTAKGSGARFNSGKAHLELIPLTIIADLIGLSGGDAGRALRHLGHWQEDGKTCHLQAAMVALGDDIWNECAGVFNYGRKKYAEWNWAKGMQWSIPVGCAARHLMAIIDGEETDPESGLSHRGHAACNIVMLLQYQLSYPEGDDRPRYLEHSS